MRKTTCFMVLLLAVFCSCGLGEMGNGMGAPASRAALNTAPDAVTWNPGDNYFTYHGKQSFLYGRVPTGYEVSHYDDLIAWEQAAGGKIAKIGLADGFGIGITAQGGVDPCWLAKFDAVFDKAAAAGISVIPVFARWWDWSSEKGIWKDNPLNQANGGPAAAPGDLLKDTRVQALWLDWLERLVRHWQGRWNIAAWDIFGYVNMITGATEPDALSFVEKAAERIRKADGLKRPVTVLAASFTDWPSLANSDGLDLLQVAVWCRYIDLNIWVYVRQLKEVCRKPILLSSAEFTTALPGTPEGQIYTNPRAQVGYRHAIWMALVSGAMNGRMLFMPDGYAIYHASLGRDFLERYAMADAAAAAFAKDVDFAGFVPVTGAGLSGELFGASLGNDGDCFIGWYRDAACAPLDWPVRPLGGQTVSLTVSGRHQVFDVEFYDTLTGDLFESRQLTVSGAVLELALPEFSDSIAFKVKPGTLPPPPWVREAYFKAANNGSGDFHGHAIACSGDTLVVGAPDEDSSQNFITNGPLAPSDNNMPNSGAVYVYRRSGNSWTQEACLKPGNCDQDDGFGWSVDIDGDVLVVGAPYEDSRWRSVVNGGRTGTDNQSLNSGAVYIYRRTGTVWAQEAYVKAVNADADDQFGCAVAIAGDIVAVGAGEEDSSQAGPSAAPNDPSDNSSLSAGAAYVYRRTNGLWAHHAFLKAANPDNLDRFGRVLSIDNDTIAVGVPAESSAQNRITNGPTASADNSAEVAGAVYVFKLRSSGVLWKQQAYLKASNAEMKDSFGASISLSGNLLAVGAFKEDSGQAPADNLCPQSGAAYVFKRDGEFWSEQAILKAGNRDVQDFFGKAVALSGDRLVVGTGNEDSNQDFVSRAPSPDNSSADSGAAYIFLRAGDDWVPESYIKAGNNDPGDLFGGALALDADHLYVGVRLEDSIQNWISPEPAMDNLSADSGAVYSYVLAK